jgi:hemerythrin superfamily protein
MDIIDLLKRDHGEVSQLFGRFSQASKPETQDELAKEIIHELSVHAAVEEQFVYPLIRRKVDGGDDLVDHAVEEHQEVKRLLADIEKLDAGQAAFTSKMEKVISSVREHVSEEESGVLPKLAESTDAGLREKVGGVVEKAKSVVPTHPHPLVPGNATAQLIAGPWAAMVDKARDLLAS